MAPERIRTVVADDHPIVRNGLRREIERDPACVVMGEAGDGEAALALIRATRPEIAVIDLDMPKLDGLGVARAVAPEHLDVALVFLTSTTGRTCFTAPCSSVRAATS